MIFQTGDIITISEPASQAGITIITNQKTADDCNSGVITATRNTRNPIKCILWLHTLDDDEALRTLRNKNFKDALQRVYDSALYSPPESAHLIWNGICEVLAMMGLIGILSSIVEQVITDQCIIPTTKEFSKYIHSFERII